MRLPGVLVLGLLGAGCTTVPLGDNFTQGEVAVSDDFFYCRVQPDVITGYGCSEGAAGEAGECHSSKSALRLRSVPTPVACDDGLVTGMISADERANFEASRSQVSGTSSSSPLLLRPIGVQSHPRIVFAPGDPPADVLRMWIDGAGP